MQQIEVKIPEGCELVGCRTDGDTVIIKFEPIVRVIGYSCEIPCGDNEDVDEVEYKR